MDLARARTIRQPGGPTFVTGKVAHSDHIIEAFRHRHDRHAGSLCLAGESLIHGDIDVTWLEAAAETYNISADPRDYVLADVPIVTVDYPNRNMQAFPYEEVSYFDPLYGKMVYQTFDRKPCHIDHENKDPLKAKGVIFDASMQHVPSYGLWKIRILAGWDRTKDPWLVGQILSKKRTAYSMGALVEAFVCSVCGATDTNLRKCPCMQRGKGQVMPTGHLVYQQCVGVNFIENSSVEDPADITADTDVIWG
jgi:hypothetical protein